MASPQSNLMPNCVLQLLLLLFILSEALDTTAACQMPEFITNMKNSVTGLFKAKEGIPKGCFADSAELKDLSISAGESDDMQSDVCNARCRQWLTRYYGIQEGRKCYCGNRFGVHGPSSSGCDMACSGDKEQKCGGKLANTVYEIPQ